MATVYVIKNNVVVHQETLDLIHRKKQLGALYRKYGTNRLFVKTFDTSGQSLKWERVEFIWNSSCTEIKNAQMFFLLVKELPPVLQMMVLVGAA